jgi:hypothetical protein
LIASPGWKVTGPMLSHSLAPLISVPNRKVTASRPAPAQRPGVLVVAQDSVVAEEDGDRHHHHQADGEPHQLRGRHANRDTEQVHARQRLRQPVEHHQPDTSDGGGQRQQQLVAAVAQQDQGEVRAEDERHVGERQRQRAWIQLPDRDDVRQRESQGHQQDNREEQAQLGAAPRDRHRLSAPVACGRDRSSARRRSSAPLAGRCGVR